MKRRIKNPEIRALLAQADKLPPQGQMAVLERATNVADGLEDVVAGYDLRMRLLNVYNLCKELDKLMVAFAWCVARCDSHKFDAQELLEEYYWACNWITATPDIPLQRLMAIHDDLERRHEQLGICLRPAYQARYKTYFRIGEEQKAAECLKKLKKVGRPDCSDCELAFEIEALVRFGHFPKALTKARRFLTQRSSCLHYSTVLAVALNALVGESRQEEAAHVHQLGFAMLARDASDFFQVPFHLLYLTHAGELGRAAAILERFMPIALGTTDIDDRFYFYAVAAAFLEKVAIEKTEVALRLPADFPAHESSGRYRTLSLAGWFDTQATHLARKFDARNHTNHYARRQTEARLLARGSLA